MINGFLDHRRSVCTPSTNSVCPKSFSEYSPKIELIEKLPAENLISVRSLSTTSFSGHGAVVPIVCVGALAAA